HDRRSPLPATRRLEIGKPSPSTRKLGLEHDRQPPPRRRTPRGIQPQGERRKRPAQLVLGARHQLEPSAQPSHHQRGRETSRPPKDR
ncbi:MAG: hypothetical protein QOF55_254, partial [Thermoleophilaceae bacterium]|nr:hypothetical protein [Thermoleophilaceae bacterium]